MTTYERVSTYKLEFAKLVRLCGLLGTFAKGTFLQSMGVLVGAPSRRIYIQSSISFLQHYVLVVTKFTSIIKVGGVDCKPGILVNLTPFVFIYREYYCQ